MCGIYGFVGSSLQERLEKKLSLLFHRGPDDWGSYYDEIAGVGLGMRRLSIIDLSTGRQPIFNEDKSMIIVFNGEIYNHKELQAERKKKGHQFQTCSDTEVILHGYEEFGASILSKLRGMFAFAIWDDKKRELFCARDRFGIKPFYYAFGKGALHFASEQKPLLDALDGDPKLNRQTLINSLVAGFNVDESTFFKGISQLPPGSHMILRDGKIYIEKYYSLKQNFDYESTPEKELMEKLRGLLYTAVEEHLESDVSVGLTLSGGLDSSIIALLMAQMRKTHASIADLTAFTVGFNVESDETSYAKKVAGALGLPHKVKNFNPVDLFTELARILWSLEEPLANITFFAASCWARYIAKYKKVTLVGEGSDELFGGYIQYRAFTGLASFLPRYIQGVGYRTMFLQPFIGTVRRLLGDDGETAGQVKDALELYHSLLVTEPKGLRAVQNFDIKYELSNNQLLRVDRMSMAYSLEARVPFLDHRLVEFAYSLPASMKVRGGVQKYLLRKAYEGELPDDIINRPKMGKRGSQPVSELFMAAGVLAQFNLLKKEWNGGALLSPHWARAFVPGESRFPPLIGSRMRQKLIFFVFLLALWEKLFLRRKVFEKKEDIPETDELLHAA